ncbi:Trypsin-like peptidase domain-containing protein [Candidatus Electrothrix aarhusensis]
MNLGQYISAEELKRKKQKDSYSSVNMSGSAKELPFSNIGNYIQLLGLLLAFGVIGSSYMKKERIGPYSAAQAPDDLTGSLRQELSRAAGLAGLDPRTVLSTVEQVRPVIVSVKTPWGRGAGFFIKKSFIITSKQVVEPDSEKLAVLQEQVQRNRQLLDFEEEKLSSYRARFKKVGRGSSRDGLKLLILERERYLVNFKVRQEKDELRLTEQQRALKHPALKIGLSDGSEQSASLVQMSQNYDLALLTVTSVQNNFVLEPSPSGSFRLGDPIFVFGDSAGSEKNVIAGNFIPGNFSGYRRVGVFNQMFLQIDVEIPLNKSGGPVLDATGYVRGIATRTERNGKNVGFAIPIERVFYEFTAVLR